MPVPVSITPANVQSSSSSMRSSIQLGEAVNAGDLLYLKSADGKWWKADCLTAEKAGNGTPSNIKMALSNGAANQWVLGADPGGDITLGTVLTKGQIYVLSATGGLFATQPDLVATNFLTIIGYATSTSVLRFTPNPTGVVL